MRISGFSFARNANKLYYPIVESIRSILPICDEFVLALGTGDEDDTTRDLIESIGDPKIKIIETHWPAWEAGASHVFAQQTNIALEQCRGDWCFYLQCDEVVHEEDLAAVTAQCKAHLVNKEVEGLLFDYRHFWGDYDHHHLNHAWYPQEIRIIRNRIDVQSYRDAQSFRINDRKLNVARSGAKIYHYGWVRPPQLMQEKRRAFTSTYVGQQAGKAEFAAAPPIFDYGDLRRITRFTGTHPAVMQKWIAQFDWRQELDYCRKSKARFKHDRFKYRLLTFIEQFFLAGRQLFGFKNYRLLRSRGIPA